MSGASAHRGDPRASLVAGLAAALEHPTGNVLVVRGSAGAGKSWLVDRLLNRLDRPVPIRRAAFVESGGGLDSLWSLVARQPSSPGVRAASFGLDGLAAASLSETLLDECPNGATVVVEDLHWADRSAQAALDLLIERTQTHPALFGIVFTLRDDDGSLLRQLCEQPAVQVAEVPPLSDDEVHAAILSLGFDRVDPQLVELVLRASGGNALYVIESVRELVDQGALRVVGDRLAGSPGVVAALPKELRAIVARRLDRMAEPVVVSAVALLGLHADASGIERLAVGVEDLDNALATGLELGLIDRVDDRYECRHQLIAQAALNRLTVDQVKELHSRAAAQHADRGAGPGEVAANLIAADHLADSSLLRTHGLAGIEALIAAGAWGSAGRLGDMMMSADLISSAVCLATGLAHHRNADPERALTAYNTAERVAVAEQDLNMVVTARCWSARSRAFTNQLSVPASLAAELDETAQLDGVSASPALLATLHASSAEILASAGILDEALSAAEAGVAAAGNDDELLGSAYSSLGITLLSTLELKRTSDALLRSRRHAEVTANKNLQVVASARTAWVDLARGDLDGAEDQLLADDELLLRHGPWAERCLAAAARCAVALGRGDLRDVAVQGERAIRLVHRSEYYLGPFLVYPTLIAGALAEGDHERAWELLDDWVETGQRGQSPARLLTRLEEGATSVVTELSTRPPARRWSGDPNFANVFNLAMITELSARSGVAGEGFERLMTTAENVAASDMRLIPTFPSTGTMMLADLLLATGDHDGAGGLYREAAEFASTIGAPLVQARALLGEASAGSFGGKPRPAAARAALAIADRLGANGLAARATELLAADEASQPKTVDGSTPLAILLTDVVSSTAIADLHGDRVYLDIIDLHDRLVRAELRRFGGQEFEHTGDGICAWFAEADAAFSCGRAIQTVSGRTASGVRLDVRTAVVFGDCYFRRGRPYGGLCNLGARVCAVGAPGSLVVTDEVRSRTDTSIPLRLLPAVPLKGLSVPPQLFEVQS